MSILTIILILAGLVLTAGLVWFYKDYILQAWKINKKKITAIATTATIMGAGGSAMVFEEFMPGGFRPPTETMIIDGDGDYYPATGDNIQTAMDDGAGTVTVPSGIFTPTSELTIPSGVWLKAQGNATVIENSITFSSGTSNNKVSDLTITTGRINVHNGYDRVIENVNIIGTSSTYAFLTYANTGTVNNTRYFNCQAVNCENFGWFTNGEGSPCLIENLTIDNCLAVGCGDGAANNWSTGFHLGEWAGLTLRNCIVTKCIAEDNWESGFHTEFSPTIENFVISDCISENNGLRKEPDTFAAGFILQNANIMNCVSRNNDDKGFQLKYSSCLSNCYVYGEQETAYGVQLESGYHNSSMTGCTIDGCGKALDATSDLHNVTIDNNVFSNHSGATRCFDFLDASSPYSSNVIFSNNNINNISADYVMYVRGYNFNIHSNIFTDCIGSTHGIQLERPGKFNNNLLEYCSDVYLTGDYIQVNDNDFWYSIADAIGTGSASDHHQINSNKFYFSGDESINIYNSDNIQMHDNKIYNNTGIGIYLEEGCNDMSLVGNHIENSSGTAIHVHAGGNGNIISLNFAYNGGSYGIILAGHNSSVMGNVIHDNLDDGLYIDGYNNTISTNRIYDNGGDGIDEHGGDWNIFVANNCLGNTGNAIDINGANSINSANLGTVV